MMENKIDTKALNEKLMKFDGIEYKQIKYDHKWGITIGGYYLNGKRIRKTAPDLVHELDLQKKYLWSKLLKLGYDIEIQIKSQPEKSYVFIKKNRIGQKVDGKNLALNFALACEKIIDGLNKTKEKNKNE